MISVGRQGAVGRALLTAAVSHLGDDGHSVPGLAVTQSNPGARHRDDELGVVERTPASTLNLAG